MPGVRGKGSPRRIIARKRKETPIMDRDRLLWEDEWGKTMG